MVGLFNYNEKIMISRKHLREMSSGLQSAPCGYITVPSELSHYDLQNWGSAVDCHHKCFEKVSE